jgi:hypothetical protein
MSEHGRGAIANAAQRAQVRQLIADGRSIRQTAAEVFGNARFRGRVERIMRSPTTPSASSPTASDAEISGLTTTELITLFLERRLAWLATRETPPSGNEIQQLLKAQLMLHQRQALERSIVGTRESALGTS